MTHRLAIAYVPLLGLAVAATVTAAMLAAPRRAPDPWPRLGLATRCTPARRTPPPRAAAPVVRPPVPEDLASALERLPLPAITPEIALPRANIVTSKGTLHCVLFPSVAPRAVASFIGLATGTRPWLDPRTGAIAMRPFYDGLTFHRAIPGFVIQAGDPLGNGTGGPGYEFPDEISDAKFQPGMLAMANKGPNTNGSQFFITVGPTAWLDGHYTIFGSCDVEVAQRIANVRTDENSRPRDPVTIEHIELTRY